MNPRILFAAIFPVFFLFSCKKDYQCECSNSNGTYNAGDPVEARGKSKANKLCGELSNGSTTCKAQ